jgi:flagellar hook assembly protein FlgD
MVYQAGDENYDMEALMSASIDELLPAQAGPLMTFPNPFSTSTQIVYANAKAGDVVSVSIYDYQGKLMRQLKNTEIQATNGFAIEWDGTTETGADARKGIYFVSMTVNGQPFTAQIIRN